MERIVLFQGLLACIVQKHTRTSCSDGSDRRFGWAKEEEEEEEDMYDIYTSWQGFRGGLLRGEVSNHHPPRPYYTVK